MVYFIKYLQKKEPKSKSYTCLRANFSKKIEMMLARPKSYSILSREKNINELQTPSNRKEEIKNIFTDLSPGTARSIKTVDHSPILNKSSMVPTSNSPKKSIRIRSITNSFNPSKIYDIQEKSQENKSFTNREPLGKGSPKHLSGNKNGNKFFISPNSRVSLNVLSLHGENNMKIKNSVDNFKKNSPMKVQMKLVELDKNLKEKEDNVSKTQIFINSKEIFSINKQIRNLKEKNPQGQSLSPDKETISNRYDTLKEKIIINE